ncbi:MAG: LuxR C-terminal-related transcriptional regulator [Leifsonia sp.]
MKSRLRFLKAIPGRELDHGSVAALLDRTEGWVAGLQLAGMTLRLRHDPAKFIAEFSGSDRLVADYLSEEVLDALPASDRTEVLELSVLDRFSVELVSQLAQDPTGSDLLARLERQSMFLIPLDDSREWFRFHQLFRDLLRYRIRSEDPPAEARILTRAALWHDMRGESGPAIDYFLRARDWERAIGAILARGKDVFERGDISTVLRWLNAIPENVIDDRVDALLLRGFLNGMNGAGALAEDQLHAVAARSTITRGQLACAQTFLAALVHWRPRPTASIAHAERALTTITALEDSPTPPYLPDREALATIALIAKGRAHFLAGNLAEARRWLETALATDVAGYSVWRISALSSLALLDAWCGRTRRAEQCASEAFALARELTNGHHATLAEAHIATALIAIERAEKTRVEAARSEDLLSYATGRDALSWVAFAGLDARDDLRANTHAPVPPAGPPPPVVADLLLAKRSRNLRLHGFPDAATRLLTGDLGLTSSLSFEKAAAELTLGHLTVAQPLIRRLADLTDAGEPLARVRALILSSWRSGMVGMEERADVLISDALQLAEDNGLVSVFVEAGPVTIRRIAHLTDGPSTFVRDAVLQSAFGQFQNLQTSELADRLADRLTDRELELITLLPTRLTNPELAARFVVSVNTVKTHMAHIYRKLGVTNRGGAIARAVQLGLVEQSSMPFVGTMDPPLAERIHTKSAPR